MVHFEKVADFKNSSDEAHTLEATISELKRKKQVKGVAIIAQADIQFGMARMLPTILDAYLPVSVIKNEKDLESQILRNQNIATETF